MYLHKGIGARYELIFLADLLIVKFGEQGGDIFEQRVDNLLNLSAGEFRSTVGSVESPPPLTVIDRLQDVYAAALFSSTSIYEFESEVALAPVVKLKRCQS